MTEKLRKKKSIKKTVSLKVTTLGQETVTLFSDMSSFEVFMFQPDLLRRRRSGKFLRFAVSIAESFAAVF